MVADVGAGRGGHAGDEVLHVAHVQAAIVRRMQVPSCRHQTRDHLVAQLRDVAVGGAQVGHYLRDGQPLDGVGHVCERRHQQKAHDILRVLAPAQVGIEGFGYRAACRGDVLRDGVFERRVDLIDLGQRLAA